MRVFEVRDSFGLDQLAAGERPEPEPSPCEVVLEMKAASLNFRDLLMVSGRYNPRQPLPLIPCSDGVGEVVAAGQQVRRVKVGDRVATLFHQKWFGGPPARDKVNATLGGPLDGTLARRMVLPEDGVVKVPEHLTDAEAATLPCAALTAWSALAVEGNVRAGDTVLVQGTGGVSLFALQFAQALGARVIVTSSSDKKLEIASQLGSWGGINYREDPDWGRTASELSGGVDHIVEVGGGDTLAQSLRAIKIGGHISLIGVLSGHAAKLNILHILMQSVRIQGILVGSRESFEAMNRAIALHRIRPVVDRVFPFDETREAMVYMMGQRHIGKVCIEYY